MYPLPSHDTQPFYNCICPAQHYLVAEQYPLLLFPELYRPKKLQLEGKSLTIHGLVYIPLYEFLRQVYHLIRDGVMAEAKCTLDSSQSPSMLPVIWHAEFVEAVVVNGGMTWKWMGDRELEIESGFESAVMKGH